ncbi:pyridoxal-phosphate dependent enzyme, partial [bacterium]
FYPFFNDRRVQFIGVEAAGFGLSSGKHSASLVAGSTGVLHGSKSSLLEDKFGQVKNAHSIAAGLYDPGDGPEHAYYKKIKRATYVAVTDKEALEGFKFLAETESIIPALEPAHAIAYLTKLKNKIPKNSIIIVCLSGRGDKDTYAVAEKLKL